MGDVVKRGQTLAQFAPATVRANLAQQAAAVAEAEAALAEAEANATRARTLQDSGAMSTQQINQYVTAAKTAAARLQSAKAVRDGETRAQWYVRQLMASCNIGGGKLLHILSGNLSHRIKHHLFSDMCSNRYPEIAPRVRALAKRYGLPYNTGSLARQYGTTTWTIWRLAFPGGAAARAS